MFEKNSYEKDIEGFKRVLSGHAEELLTNEEKVVVYIGRATCPYCRKFAKKLSSLVDKIDTTIYYVNSEDLSDSGLKEFRSKYNIRTVPGFIVHKNREVEVRCDSSTPEDEILNMIK